MQKVRELLPAVKEEMEKELTQKVKVILTKMEKEIKATEIVLETMKQKRDEFLAKDIKELTFIDHHKHLRWGSGAPIHMACNCNVMEVLDD